MWAGTVPVHHVIILTDQLVLNPHSRVFAIRGGSLELMGWDTATVVAVRTHNMLTSLLQGMAGKHDPEMFIDYPGVTPEEKQPATIAELYRIVDQVMQV